MQVLLNISCEFDDFVRTYTIHDQVKFPFNYCSKLFISTKSDLLSSSMASMIPKNNRKSIKIKRSYQICSGVSDIFSVFLDSQGTNPGTGTGIEQGDS